MEKFRITHTKRTFGRAKKWENDYRKIVSEIGENITFFAVICDETEKEIKYTVNS